MNQPTKTVKTTTQGIIIALVAFLLWGNFPLYFKELSHYNAIEVIVHRVVWTFVLLLIVLMLSRRTAWLGVIRHQPKWLGITFIAALLIGTNWLTYVWAVTHDQVLEASLGYFINPLMGVALSLVFLKEKLRNLQKIAVLLAAIAVGIQVVWLGGLPWVSLLLALSFSVYGIIQRQTPFDAIDGLFLETALLLPLCLLWLSQAGVASSSLDLWLSADIWLLMLSGPITLIPLLLYNKSTKMVSFTLLSFMGYLTPSIVFLLAVFLYKEPFSLQNIIVFGLIWTALAIFSIDLLKRKSN
ncbi:EamA family transporter RarD [Moraxella sp. RCAD0137]|uniref:EamA family transporter RarD n=1 Tax=Moraxella sp. RCAD0137 TaxID=1775913 RepID=UPI000C9FDAFE|nr:EamA family transporter RarD [Moraxella sp. RCAD0137]PNP99052.1 chloramphenical resistance permease RarD [Moraxella sp. RCAD0137]